MPIVRTRLRNHVDDRSRIAPVLRVKSIRQNTKFLNAVGRGLHRRKVDEKIVGVAAVHAEIVRASAATVHRHRAGTIAAINQRVAGPDRRHDSRLQLQKLISVARIQRQVRDLLRIHHRAELRARGVDQRRLRGHFDRLFVCADLQHRIESDHLVEIDVHPMLQIFLETGEIELHAINSDDHLRKTKLAARI